MLCRAVLTAVAITYLICVLWLSGMQREDLDVNLLRKLQRHNVNIDDMGHEALKQQCLNFKLNKDNATKEVKDKDDDDKKETTTDYIKLDNKNKDKTLLEGDLKTFLTNLMDTKTIKTIDDKTEVTPKFKDDLENEYIQNQNTDIFNTPSGEHNTEKFVVKYENDQPKLASIIKFWQMFATTTSSYNYLDAKIRKPNLKHPIPSKAVHEQNNIKIDTKKVQPKETDYINKLLADFININKKPTTEKPTTAPIDLKKLSEQIEKLLKLYPQSGTLGYSKPLPDSEVEIVDDIEPNGYKFVKKEGNIFNYEPTYAPNTRINNTSSNVTKTNALNTITNDCIKDIAENVKAIVLKDLRKDITSISVRKSVLTTTMISTTTPSNQNKLSSAQPLTVPVETRKKPPQNKTQEATQAIAKFMQLLEQFKSMKDKTEIIYNTKNLPTNVTHQEFDNAFKVSLHAPKAVIDPYKVKKPPENPPELYNPYSIHTPRIVQNFPIHNAKLVQINPMQLTSQSFYKVQVKPITIQTNSEEIRPLGIPISKPLKLIHQNIVITTTRPLVTQKSHRDRWVDQYEHKDTINIKERYKHYPIPPRHARYRDTIKPLDQKPYKDGRLDELEYLFKYKEKKPFNQNSYKDNRLREFEYLKDVTKSVDQKTNMNARQREFENTFKDADQKSYKFITLPEFKDDKLLDQKSYKDERISEFDEKLSFHRPYESSRYINHDNNNPVSYKSPYDVKNFKSNENKKEYSDEHKHFDNISYGVLSRNRNSERFHEKLERVNDSLHSGNIEDYKGKLDVASRQQQPLNMKESRFDDTHFNNFLKTQQKVNDMLEKILSSKTRQNGPQSVETT